MAQNIEIIKGDLFHAYTGYKTNDGDRCKIHLAHGVNCVGAMGAGIAVSFKNKFPDMYQEYNARCKRGLLIPGYCWVWQTTWDDGHFYNKDGRIEMRQVDYTIYNLAIKSHWKLPASYVAMEGSLKNLAKELKEREVKEIAMPWIGCGLGGLSKQVVKKLLENTLASSTTKVIIYEP